MIIITKRMSKTETKNAVALLTKWFEDNPRRKVCNADLNGIFVKVKRNSIKEDVVREIGQDYKEKKNEP